MFQSSLSHLIQGWWKELIQRPGLRKILSNTSWLYADRLLRMGINLVIGVGVARYLGPTQFGLYNYAIAFVSLFSALASLGLDGIVVRNLVRSPDEKNIVLGTAFGLKLMGGIAACMAAIGAIVLLRPSDELMTWLVGLTAVGFIFQAWDVVDFWFQSQVQSKYVVWAKTLAFSLTALVKLGLIYYQAPLIVFAGAGLGELTIGAIGLAIVYHTQASPLQQWRFRLNQAKQLIADSWPLIFSILMVGIYLRVDQVMLGEMVSEAELGVYSVAVKLTELWNFLPLSIIASTFPSIVAAKAVSEDLFYDRLQKLYNLIALISYSIALPVTLFANILVKTLFGEAYGQASLILMVLVWSLLFTSLGVVRSSFLTAMNWTTTHFFSVLLGCFMNIGLNYYLIPWQGGLGAAIASCIAYWFAAHGFCLIYPPLFKTGRMLTRAMLFPNPWMN